jgi:ATP-binding cassette subfamily B protein
MDQRAAFARARSFLNYHPVAKWSSLAAAVGTSILFVVLLMLLGLFADLVVNRGQIPALHNISETEQQRFKEDWTDALSQFPAENAATKPGGSKAADEWRTRLRNAGVTVEKDDAQLKRAWQLRAALIDLGFEPAEADEWTVIAARNPTKLTESERALRWELVWRVYLYRFLQDHAGDGAATHFKNQFVSDARSLGLPAALNRDAPNMGILSLVFRTQHRLDNWVFGLLARVVPALYDSGATVYLTIILILAVVVAVIRAVLNFVEQYAAAQAVIGATTRLRRAMYHHTYRLGTLAFRALGPSEAVSISTRHLEAVHDGLFAWLTIWVREPIKFALLLVFALCVNLWLAVAFLMFAVLVWIGGGQIAAWFRRQGRLAQHHAVEQLALIQESITLMRLVKVYLMELFNQARIERQLANYAAALSRRYLGEAIYRPLLVFLGLLAALVLLFVTGLVIVDGTYDVTAASAVTLTVGLVSLYWPLTRWLENRRLMRRARESSAVVFNFLDRSSSVGQAVEAEFLPPMTRQLEFDNVTLLEPGSTRKLLDGISLTVQAGQRVAVVGPDDMQKLALVYLIPRFFDPTTGEIRIDRKNLRWVTFDSLRAGIAIVLQHNLVFNDTVANNIGCGDPSFQLAKIMEAAKVAHAHKFIQNLPQGYETQIGEMGHPLTLSERFRIAVARAVLRDPALLIIEEPLIPLDEDSKSLLDDTYARVLPGRTAIFLPHRLSTIRNCDKVFFLYEGRIEAAGEHKELLTSNELYRHLQYMEFNEFAGLTNLQPATAES